MWHTVLDSVLTAGDNSTPCAGANSCPVQAPPGLAPLTAKVIGWTKYAVLAAGVFGILLCAGMVILGRRNRNQLAIEGMIGGAWVLGGLAMASVAAVLVGAFTL